MPDGATALLCDMFAVYLVKIECKTTAGVGKGKCCEIKNYLQF